MQETNRFCFKHIHVIAEAATYGEMEKVAKQVLKNRMNASKRNPQFGGTKPSGSSTVVVTNPGGFEEMNAWVEDFGVSGENLLPVLNAAILSCDVATKLTRSENERCIKVTVRVNGSDKHVTHYSGAGGGAWDATDDDVPLIPFWHDFHFE